MMNQTYHCLYNKQTKFEIFKRECGEERVKSKATVSLAQNIFSNFLLVWLSSPVGSKRLKTKTSPILFQLVIQVCFRFHIRCNHMRSEIGIEMSGGLSTCFINVDYSKYGMVLEQTPSLKLVDLAEMAP